jgi:hypothetical protein
MAISINLLPTETAVLRKEQARFRLVQAISTAVLLIFVLLASMLVAIRILQSKNISNVQVEATNAENKITSSKDKEASLVVLKSRLDLLTKIVSSPSKQVTSYLDVSTLIPQSVTVSSLSVDRTGSTVLTVLIPNESSLLALFNNVTSAKTLDKYAQVDIDSLSRARDGAYRANLKITQTK